MHVNSAGKSSSTTRVAKEAIDYAARQTGVSFDYLMAQAKIESSYDPLAKAKKSSAAGLFQFTKQTWLSTLEKHGALHGLAWAADSIQKNSRGRYLVTDPQIRSQILDLRYDPVAASVMAARLAEDNAQHLRDRTGAEPEAVDLYLAHFLGASDAATFLKEWRKNPEALGESLFPDAAGSNPEIFYKANGAGRTLDAIRRNFATKISGGEFKDIPAAIAQSRSGQVTDNRPPALTELASSSAPPLQLRAIEPMPGKLSLELANKAYRQLSDLD